MRYEHSGSSGRPSLGDAWDIGGSVYPDWLGLTDVNQLFSGAETVILVGSFIVGGHHLSAGRAAATGKVGSRVLAGLLAGLISGLIGHAVSVVFFSPMGKVSYDLLIQALVIMASLAFLVLDIGLGVGMGAIGAVLGRNKHQQQASSTS